MERICAARAMEWSIELEKGLRSKKPGGPIEAILQIGPRLEQWSKEPCPTMVMLNMFGLVPGEDKLFANAILLRLADAFRSGDKNTKISVLKIFLLEHKRRIKKGKQYRGILARERVPNYLEMLRRVKIVFDMGDVESRALALRLLGCWVDIAKDNAEIRHMILSSLGSCHVLEVKASLFAAGYFSELSEDFASIVLEVLINMVTSSKTSSALKLAGVRVFAKMGCSSTLARRAYKTGRKLVLNNYQEEFLIGMLIALSKLASKSISLIPEQVDFLLLFITEKHSKCMHMAAFQCLFFLLGGGICCFPINVSVIRKLFHVLSSNFPAISQNGALRILCKIFRSMQPSLPHMEVSELVKLASDVERAAKSPIIGTRILALQLLVDISCNHIMAMETVHAGDGSLPLPSHIAMLLLDQIVQLVKPVVLKHCGTASKLMSERQSLLKLVLYIVEEYPTVGVVALNKIRSCIESLVDDCKEAIGARKPGSPPVRGVLVVEGENLSCFASKFACYIYRFVESCIETLDEAKCITNEVHEVMKLLVEVINQSNIFKNDICVVYSLLLLYWGMWSCSENENKETCNIDNDLAIRHNDNWIEHQRLSLVFTKKIIAEQDYWASYRAGKRAACQGAWFAAAVTFRKLMDKVQSDVCHYWLRSLALFARSESTILLLFSKRGSDLVNSLQINEIWVKFPMETSKELGQHDAWNDDSLDISENLNKAYGDVCSAAETLAAALTTDKTFVFQKWFLTLRAKVLETVVDMVKLLSSYTLSEENIGHDCQVDVNMKMGLLEPEQHIHSLLYFLSRILFRLTKLVKEFDLLATSFIGMDNKSFRTIANLVLNCSLLAFCTGFALYPNLHTYKQSMYSGAEKGNTYSLSVLIQDLAERLCHIDSETSTNLNQLLTLFGEANNCFCAPHRALVDKAGHGEKETLDVCRFAVFGVLSLHEEAVEVNNEEILPQYYRTRLQLLSNVLKKWIGMSFHVPKYFFHIRPCISAELFVFNPDGKTDGLSIFSGFHLSLNLCLQLKHEPPIRVSRLYCILASRPSYRMPKHVGQVKEQVHLSFQAWEDDDAVDLNEKLLLYVKKGTDRTGKKRGRCSDGDGSVWSCVEFEPNERRQGFSTCLLDVSAFPVGSYKIKWHGGCIDSRGSYWSLLPLNTSPLFNVNKAPGGG